MADKITPAPLPATKTSVNNTSSRNDSPESGSSDKSSPGSISYEIRPSCSKCNCENIASCTSLWTRGSLTNFGIKTTRCSGIKAVYLEGLDCRTSCTATHYGSAFIQGFTSDFSQTLQMYAEKLAENAAFSAIDFQTCDSDRSRAVFLEKLETRPYDCFWALDDTFNWYQVGEFRYNGGVFVKELIEIADLAADADMQVPKIAYQTLFTSFCKLLRIHASPCPMRKEMRFCLKGREHLVTSLPDVIVRTDKPIGGDGGGKSRRRIVAVVQVNKDPPWSEYSPVPEDAGDGDSGSKRRRLDAGLRVPAHSTQTGSESMCHLPDNLIGQHCGELLLQFEDSAHQSCVWGLIVQKTHITFTSLWMTQKQLQRMCDGTNLQHEDEESVEFRYTKPYNYLKKSDRNEIIKYLLLIGTMQRTVEFKKP